MNAGLETVHVLLWVGSNLLVICAGILIRVQMAYREVNRIRKQREEEVNELRFKLHAATCVSEYVRKRIPQLEKQINELNDRQGHLELNGPDGRPFSHAIRMVQHGATAERLVRSCGLTPGEADLVIRLHGNPAGTS